MSERLLALLSEGGASPVEKLRALGLEMRDELRAEFLHIRLEGVGEVALGALGDPAAEVDRRSIGSAARPLGEIAVSPAGGADLAPFVRCAELIHRLQTGYVDGLTGLYNRRRLDLELSSLPFSADVAGMIMMDIDHFKRVNDTYGHDAGDAVLREFAARLSRAMPENGFLARYGGEEFCAIFPGLDEESSAREAERIRMSAIEDAVAYGKHLIRFTSSAGIAAGSTRQYEEIIRRADEALYAAKEGGRNLAVRSSEVRRRKASRLLSKRFRRILDRPLYDLAACGQRVLGLDRAEGRAVYVDYFGGVVTVGGSMPGAISAARDGRSTYWVPAGERGFRVLGRNVPSWVAELPELRRVHCDAWFKRLYLIERRGQSLFWTDLEFTQPRKIELPDPGAITAVLPVGRSLLVLDALSRRIFQLDRMRLTTKRVWPLEDQAYEICMAYIPSLKSILIGGSDGMKFLSAEGAVEEQSDQPVVSACAQPLVGLVLSTPEETVIVR